HTPVCGWLEARRQTLDGGSAVGSVLLDAVPAAPDRDRAVSAQFEAAYGVALRFFTPGLAPREPDVFDYCPISCERGDTLFSVQPVPPSQGDAKLAALRGATQRGGAGGRRRGSAGARGAVPRPLPRPRHRTAGGRRGVRLVDVVGDGGRDRRDGTHPRRRGAGAWHERAATRALDPPGGVRVGGRR